MNRISKVILVLLAIMCLSITACFANMPRADIAVGGITIGSSLNYVKQIYGEPTVVNYEDGEWHTGKNIVYNYNNLFIVKASLRHNTVNMIICREKGLSTPGGIAVGMKYDIVRKIYGKGERIDLFEGSPKDGNRHYGYGCGLNTIVFVVDKKGIIQEIRIYYAA